MDEESVDASDSCSTDQGPEHGACKMVYQYVFEEGLELSLVTEKEVDVEGSPFLLGSKILELGLTGFTGRLIITQQDVKQYSLEQRLRGGSMEPYQAREAAAILKLPPNTSKRKDKQGKGGKSRKRTSPGTFPDVVDELAAVFVSRLAARPLPVSADNISVDGSVEVFSVASSVSTRVGAAHAKRERTLDQLAAVFAAPNKREEDKVPIDDGSSMGSAAKDVAAAIAKKEETLNEYAAIFAAARNAPREDTLSIDDGSSVGGSKASHRSAPGSPLSEFASVFVALSGPPTRPAHTRVTAIDEESSEGSSHAAPSSSSASDSRVPLEQVPEDPLSQFTTAFAQLTGTGASRFATVDIGGSIDSSTNVGGSASSQLSKSDVAPSSGPSRPDPQDTLFEFTEVFAALSGPSIKPVDNVGSIDEGSPLASAASSHHNQPKQPLAPVDEYVASFMALSGQARPEGPTDRIDEDEPSLTHSSSLSASSTGSEQSSQEHEGRQIQTQTQSLDPLDEYAEAFQELTSPPAPKKPTEVIDEESPESKAATHQSAAPSIPSMTASEEPLVMLTRIYGDESHTQATDLRGAHGPTNSQVPQPPSGKSQADTAQISSRSQPPEPPIGKSPADTALLDNSQSQISSRSQPPEKRNSRRSSTQSYSRGIPGMGPKMSAEKKRRIREMFPNYPDVSVGSRGSLDPVGAYLQKKVSMPFEKTLSTKDLGEMLEVFPFAAYCADDKGRLPLHILGENSLLVRNPQGRQRATSLARILIYAYPQSVTYPDCEGRLPFVALLQEWVEGHYGLMAGEGREKSGRPGASLTDNEGRNRIATPSLASGEKKVAYHKLFPSMTLWADADWCLSMLSMVLDDMGGDGLLRESFANRPISEQMEARRRYVADIIQSVPYLLKSVLFIDGGEGAVRKRVMSSSFVRRALLCKESVGKWLQDMNKKKGLPSKLVVDYIQLLSQTTPADFVGPKRSVDERDLDAFHYQRDRVYRAIERLQLVLPPMNNQPDGPGEERSQTMDKRETNID